MKHLKGMTWSQNHTEMWNVTVVHTPCSIWLRQKHESTQIHAVNYDAEINLPIFSFINSHIYYSNKKLFNGHFHRYKIKNKSTINRFYWPWILIASEVGWSSNNKLIWMFNFMEFNKHSLLNSLGSLYSKSPYLRLLNLKLKPETLFNQN